ncbi:MAG: hypothetical protein K9K66_04430 [Desulfarculaceae bacterium]|nr:hypothetical protein [Desulfarculaceae bacterium]MCF8073290.1 hypothetical protein [Desulfarculaceae bacterium]MCF8100886.1 hypothetical protein [Desulfarculaceae bacterium]MCF8116658.1 hypothetical protein [Desulfarculaceae bacterium]
MSDEPTFIETLPEDIQGHEVFSGIEDAGGLAAKTLELHGQLAEASKPPEVPEAYEFSLAEGQEEPLPVISAFGEIAKELGLDQERFAKVEKWANGYLGGLTEQHKTKAKEAREAAAAKLKKDWANDFDANLAMANKVATKLGLTEALEKAGLGNDPTVVRALHGAHSLFSEDAFEEGGGGGGDKELSASQAMGFDNLGKK